MPTSRSNKPNVVITMGDPSGIGPEVTLKALASPEISGLANFLVIGDRFVIDRTRRRLRIKFNTPLLDLKNVPQANFAYGESRPAFGMAAMQYLDKAVELLGSGEADCLVTAPVNKSSIRAAGFSGFQGHTEYLAAKTASKEYAMMFVGERLKVTLVTRHIALKDVSRSLSTASIYRAIYLTHKYLKEYFGIRRPAIAVAGLNPHAGEKGAFGREESRVIVPAVKRASKALGGVSGPFPPDAIFHSALTGKFDAAIALYHDQGLIPFKLLYFSNGVNLTLGLPFIRTSPDHGTAFEIAGKGAADPSSMIEAVKLACRLSAKA